MMARTGLIGIYLSVLIATNAFGKGAHSAPSGLAAGKATGGGMLTCSCDGGCDNLAITHRVTCNSTKTTCPADPGENDGSDCWDKIKADCHNLEPLHWKCEKTKATGTQLTPIK